MTSATDDGDAGVLQYPPDTCVGLEILEVHAALVRRVGRACLASCVGEVRPGRRSNLQAGLTMASRMFVGWLNARNNWMMPTDWWARVGRWTSPHDVRKGTV